MRRFIQIRLSIMSLAGNGSGIGSRQDVFLADRALVVKPFDKNGETTVNPTLRCNGRSDVPHLLLTLWGL